MKGIIFNSDASELYLAGFGTTGSIHKVTSTNNWLNATVNVVYAGSCTNDGLTTLAIAQDSDVLAYCSNNFGSAPYNISVLKGVVSSGVTSMNTGMLVDGFGANREPEGIEYDVRSNSIIFGSLTTGGVFGLPASVSGSVFGYNESNWSQQNAAV